MSGGPGGSRRHEWLAGLGLVLGTVLVVLCATELVLRVRHFPFSGSWTPSENAMAQFDPELGWSYVPNGSYRRTFGKNKREVSIVFDARGARIAEDGPRHRGDRPEILLVGGSFTMGHGLFAEETFGGILDADPALPYDVVNLGVQGYGTDQSLLMLRRELEDRRCVAVVYTYIDKHIRRNETEDRRLMIPAADFLGTKPRFSLRDDGTLFLADRPRRYEDMFQLNLWNWIRLVRYRRAPPPTSALTEALVREMARTASEHGARFILVDWRQGSPVKDLPQIDWSEALAGLNVRIVNPWVDPPPGWNDWLIPGDGHPDARAHAWVAAQLLEAFREEGLAPSPAVDGSGSGNLE